MIPDFGTEKGANNAPMDGMDQLVEAYFSVFGKNERVRMFKVSNSDSMSCFSFTFDPLSPLVCTFQATNYAQQCVDSSEL
jgi:hypothetical protein